MPAGIAHARQRKSRATQSVNDRHNRKYNTLALNGLSDPHSQINTLRFVILRVNFRFGLD